MSGQKYLSGSQGGGLRFRYGGFALIEVQVSIVVISIAAFALIKMQTFIEQRGKLAIQEVEAFQLIENKLEVWRAGSDIRLASSSIGFESSEITAGEDTSFPPFHLSWQVNEPLVSVKEIVISARWLDSLGQTHSVSARTMLSMYTVHNADFTSDFDYP